MSLQSLTQIMEPQSKTLKVLHLTPCVLTLDNARQKKTLDFGAEGVVCSVSSLGEVISISTYHPQHGIVVVNPFAQFPGGDKFWDQAYVRMYRRKFLDCFNARGSGFGLKLSGEIKNLRVGYVDGQWPRINYNVNGIEVESSFLITAGPDPSIINSVILFNKEAEERSVAIEFGGKVSVNRASYGQLTEAGPVPIPPCLNRPSYRDGVLSINNPNLPATFDTALYAQSGRISLSGSTKESSEPIDILHTERITISPWQSREITAVYRLSAIATPFSLPQQLNLTSKQIYALDSGFVYSRETPETELDCFVIRRTLDYILSCCCIPIDQGALCVLTDHIALPLGWHRDNYWQIRFLRTVQQHVHTLFHPSTLTTWKKELGQMLYRHLVWIYDRAERTDEGYWGRSYLATGALKDKTIFQLDQQCYPLLELAEYLDSESISPEKAHQWGATIDSILDVLLQRRASDKWVFQTNETPGDDPVSMQYHFSSNVLVWHALRKLVPHAETLALRKPIKDWIDLIHRDTLEAFTTTHNGKPIFAYLCDLQGNYEIYHDANDLPSVLAPEWSFCKANDSRWLNLFKFAFSTDNSRAFFPNGEYSGLGSVHTTDPWPLGDAQEMLFAHTLGDEKAVEEARIKVLKKMQWDGVFAEANDAVTGQVTSKHWFSWPGSVIAAAFIEWHF